MRDEDLPECVRDLISVAGLRRLARERPTRWNILLHQNAPPVRPVVAGVTVAQFLGGGWVDDLLPRHRHDMERLRRDRGSAGRLVALVGDVPMEDVDESFLAGVRAALLDGEVAAERGALSGEVATRTTSLLRNAAVQWANTVGERSRVAERAPASASPTARRPPRRTPPLTELRRLLHAAWPWERAILALALGGGLRESEIVGLRRRDLGIWRAEPRRRDRRRPPEPPQPPRVEVLLDVTPAGIPPSRDRRVRVAALPRWAADLFLSPQAGLINRNPADFLFPHRSDPTRPRTGFRDLVRKIRARDGRPWNEPPSSLATLRHCWQRVAREASAPREVVRQSWWVPQPSPRGTAESTALAAVRHIASAWTTLDAPIARVLAFRGTLPRRAPKGCAPDEPEKADPWRGWEQLPPSCR